MNQGKLTGLPLDLAGSYEMRNGAVKRLVHRPRRPTRLGHAFKQVHDEGVNFQFGAIADDYLDFQVRSPLCLMEGLAMESTP
jgi:hypothetical protein